jgi:hypothetical protein
LFSTLSNRRTLSAQGGTRQLDQADVGDRPAVEQE